MARSPVCIAAQVFGRELVLVGRHGLPRTAFITMALRELCVALCGTAFLCHSGSF
jgi:hypothetical protein